MDSYGFAGFPRPPVLLVMSFESNILVSREFPPRFSAQPIELREYEIHPLKAIRFIGEWGAEGLQPATWSPVLMLRNDVNVLLSNDSRVLVGGEVLIVAHAMIPSVVFNGVLQC